MRVALLCLVVLTFACKEKNPHFCEMPPCVMVDAAESCSATKMCTTGHCKDNMVCVQCLENSHCEMASAPACNLMTNTCGPCTKHSDCPSTACLPNGMCAAEADVAYVKAGGTMNAMCSKLMPCADLTQALAVTPMKSTIKVDGTVSGPTTTIANRDVTILGQSATLTRTGTTEVIVADGSSKVRIYDVTIQDALGASGAGVASTTGHTGELELQRCTVTNNNYGVYYQGTGLLIVSRSTVSLNPNGGIVSLNLGKFDLTNNFVFRNGNENTALYGGIWLATTQAAGSRLEFNTVVDNDSLDGIARAGGIVCDIPAFPAANNIVANNEVAGNNAAANSQTRGMCVFTSSIVQNDTNNLNFASAAMPPFSYKINLGSTAIDKAMSGAQLGVDNEGQPRPNGMFRDMGADEYYAP